MRSTKDLSQHDDKIGGLFMAGMPGPHPDEKTEMLIRDHGLGGVILFSRNIESPRQLAALCNALQDQAMTYHGTPLFLAIDQEGGSVARLKEPFALFPGNTAIGEDERPIDQAKVFARITAMEMALVGLNMDLAPVVDVQCEEPEKHLLGRTFSDDPQKVALLGRTVVRILQENGVMAVAKHFPGLGKASLDPHFHLPKIDMTAKELEEVNFPPFKAVIEQDVAGIMTSHALYPILDPELPATLSRKTLEGVLRERLGFTGLIITDDLEMGALRKQWSVAKGAVSAFEAGADILLICQDQDKVLEGIKTLRDTFVRGDIPWKRLRQSLSRIKEAKSRFLGQMRKASLDEVGAYFEKEKTAMADRA
jgi:beta-N-acetylhexosaminidase